jgi:hypothetical protein
MNDDLRALLQGSRQLQAEIHDHVHLPPVTRSLQQIQEETRALAAAAATGEPPASDVSTYRFLAMQGIDAGALDPSELTLANNDSAWETSARASEAWKGSIEGLLQFEQQQILMQVRLSPPPRRASRSHALLARAAGGRADAAPLHERVRERLLEPL